MAPIGNRGSSGWLKSLKESRTLVKREEVTQTRTGQGSSFVYVVYIVNC